MEQGVNSKVNFDAPYMRKQSNLDLIIPLKMILGAVYTKLKVALDYTCKKKFG